MKQMTDDEILAVLQRIYTRSFGWPDGTTLMGMPSDTVNDAMEILIKRMEKDKEGDRK